MARGSAVGNGWLAPTLQIAALYLFGAAASQANSFDCGNHERRVVWEADSFIERFLYGNQKRFSIELSGISVGFGDVRPESIVDLEAFTRYQSEAFAGSSTSQAEKIDSAILEYVTTTDFHFRTTYFRIIYLEQVVGFGFFGDDINISKSASRPQAVTVYFRDPVEGMMEIYISYSTEAEDSCVFRDATMITLEIMSEL